MNLGQVAMPASLRRAIERTKLLSLDLEGKAPLGMKASEAKNPRVAIPTLLSIASDKEAFVFDFDDPITPLLIKALLSEQELEIVIQNPLYDLVLIDARKIISIKDVKATIRDPMICQFLIHEEADKDLKTMVREHCYYRMVTYDEVKTDNDDYRKIVALKEQITNQEKRIKAFTKIRPWPTFDSTNYKIKKVVSAQVTEIANKRWPENHVKLSKDGTVKQVRSKEATLARKQFLTEQKEIIEDRFGELAQLEFEAWSYQHVIQPAIKEIEECEKRLKIAFLDYAKDDAKQTLRLWKKLSKKLIKQGLGDWLDIECYVRKVTVEASVAGIPINLSEYEHLKQTLEPLIEEFKAQIGEWTKGWSDEKGRQFNPNSDFHVRQFLFVDRDIPIPKFIRSRETNCWQPKLTKGGDKFLRQSGAVLDLDRPETVSKILKQKYVAVDSETLERINHPIGMALLNLSVAEKIYGTYIKKNIEKIKIHPFHRLCGYFNSIGTNTGRMSSKSPNLQNIPSRKKGDNYDKKIASVGMKIRKAFCASPGKVMIVCDQSQIELRVIAHFTQDAAMLDIYREGVLINGVYYYTGDIHSKTAKQLNIPRKLSKNVNFGFNYGMGPLKFARQIRLFKDNTNEYDIEKAKEWRVGFFRTYPGIPRYTKFLEEHWKKGTHEFRMLSGRKRHFDGDDLSITGGTILNAKVQGSSADIVKINIMIIDRYVKPLCPSLELLFQVHDELGYQCDPAEATLASMLIKYVMEQHWFPGVSVPILAGAKVCDSWEAKDDDNVPEVGYYYAQVKKADGSYEDRVFTPETWKEFVELDKQKLIGKKSATAMLTQEMLATCRKHIPQPTEIPELKNYWAQTPVAA